MTFSAKAAAGFIARHRFLVYAVATLLITAILLLTYSPAHADGNVMPSPADLTTAGQCQYLAFCRWNNLVPGGQPPIIGIAPHFISTMLFMIGHMIFLIIGWVMIIVTGSDLYWNLLYFGDWLFSQFSVISNGSINTTGIVATLVFVAVAVAGFMLVPGLGGNLKSRFGADKNAGDGSDRFGRPLPTMLWMIGGLITLSVMASNSHVNHDGSGRSAIGRSADSSDNGQRGTTNNASIGTLARDPANWQPLSLGWAVSWGGKVVSLVGNAAVGFVGQIAEGLNFATDHGDVSNCDAYVKSMHYLYGNTAAGAPPAVIALDDLYKSSVLNSYVGGYFGSSTGAKNAWCRVLDRTAPVAEQVLISHYAGLYQPALAVMIDDSKHWISNKDHSSVNKNDSFKGPNFGAGLATSFFGTPGTAPDSVVAHDVYFAMCISQGDDMVFNPEWNGVIRADGDTDSLDSKWVTDKNNICRAMATSDAAGLPLDGGETNGTVAVGFWSDATDALGDGGAVGVSVDTSGFQHAAHDLLTGNLLNVWPDLQANRVNAGPQGKTDFQKKLTYWGASSTNPNVLDLLFNGAGLGKTSKFTSAADGGLAGPAYNYYSATNGIRWDSGFLLSIIMLIVVITIARIAVPLMAGAVVAQLMVAILMGFLPLSLGAMVVWPTRAVRSGNLRMYGGMVAGSIVNLLFSGIFMVYSGLFGFVKAATTLPGQIGMFSIASTAEGIGLLVASYVSYAIMKFLLAKFLKFDATSIRGAVSSSFGAVAGGMTRPLAGLRGATGDALRSARGLVKEPKAETKTNRFGKLRKATADSASDVARILKAGRTAKEAIKPTQKSALITPNNATNVAVSVTPKVTAKATAGSGTKTVRGGLADAVDAAGQHMQKLMDRLKKAYGASKFAAVFPNGLPGNWEKILADAPLAAVQRLAKMLRAPVMPSEKPRATAQEAAENLRRFNAAGDQTLRTNPGGFDQNISYAERAAAMANMFRNVNPLTLKDLSKLSPDELRAYNRREFDRVGSVLPERGTVSFADGADVIRGEIVPDPVTDRSIPNAVVRSGSQNLAPVEGVTEDGTTILGAKPSAKGKPGWDLATLDSGARSIPTGMLLPGAAAPAGVGETQWAEVGDLHRWIRERGLSMDNTSVATWPAERREQASRVAQTMALAMRNQGVPMVSSTDLERYAESGIGIMPSESFGFGDAAPGNAIDVSAVRNAIAEGRKQMAELQGERMQQLVQDRVRQQMAKIEPGFQKQEALLDRRLADALALTNNEAAAQLEGLTTALGRSNSEQSQRMTSLASAGQWDDLANMLDERRHGDDPAGAELRSEIRDIVSASHDRTEAAKMSHARNVADLYSRLAAERETIVQRTHEDIESELQGHIEQNVADASDLALASASETGRRHVESVMRWFPAVQQRLFSGSTRAPQVPEEAEDVNGNGIDDREEERVEQEV